jgi:hypothetical protein
VDTNLLRQLNDDIWHPFRLAYAKLDTAAFLDLPAPELIRAGSQTKQVFGFVERIAVNELASERGIFQIVSKRADGDGRTFYGRFHTYVRCTDGTVRDAGGGVPRRSRG